MTLAEGVLVCLWVGLTAYAIFGGADFGGGIWDLFAGGTKRGARQRDLIEHSIAPVWEANHVWLIFVLVVLWTGFPPAFAAVASTLYIPLTLAALGMIARGSAFAFRKSIESLPARRFFGALFAFSSLITPFFLGCVAGGVASGQVPPGLARGHVISSWVNPTSLLGGALAVGICGFLAAVFLCDDARREGDDELVRQFRNRAVASAVVVGLVGLVGLFVVRQDAPYLWGELFGRALPCLVVSAVAGVASLGLLVTKRFVAARVSATAAVTGMIWGWALAQYPYMLIPSLTIDDAAAGATTLRAMLVVLLVGSLLLVPALLFMYALFQRPVPQRSSDHHTSPVGPSS